MGTRNDFYIGRDPETMEWLGSQAWDGHPEGVFEETGEETGYITPFFVRDVNSWRQEVSHYLSHSGSATWPEEGWPWPWDDSRTTDFAYTYDDGQIWASCFGSPWVTIEVMCAVEDDEGEEGDDWNPPGQAFPDMSARKNVRMDQGSGLLIMGANGPVSQPSVSNRGGVAYPKAYPSDWSN